MYDLKKLARLTWIEILKFWYRPIARVVLILMIVGPILGEILLAQISPRDAIYPRVTTFWFSILSKIIATIIAALIFGFTFIGFALLSSIIAHLRISDIPLFDAAGGDLLFRALGAGSVIGLVNFVLSGIVMLALVLGRSSWIGMLGGIGSFFLDFFIGGIGSGSVFGVEDAYRYTITYHAVSILEKVFPSDQSISLPRAWAEQGFANPSQAILVLLLYGTGITFLTIFLFRRQDLLARI
jgi:hypothetical protein